MRSHFLAAKPTANNSIAQKQLDYWNSVEATPNGGHEQSPNIESCA